MIHTRYNGKLYTFRNAQDFASWYRALALVAGYVAAYACADLVTR